jgi:GcrA cell cycle regulator
MEWNDETIIRLRQLWDEGLSTAEIGRRLNVSKNAVVGKAHRMLLPPRPSPIRRDGAAPARPAPPRRVVGPTLPPLPASLAPPAPRPATAPHLAADGAPINRSAAPLALEPAHRQAVPTQPLPTHPAPTPPAADAAAPIRAVPPASGRHSACCWPLGDPGTRSFRFCDGASLPGKPYCAEHAQVAYVKVRDRREEAA